MPYAKLDSGIIHSSIWSEDDRVVRLWITILAMKKFDGRVESSVPGLARAANIPLEDCERGLLKLMSPDPYSRTKDNEGRRIAEVEGGWLVLNHEKYRDKRDRSEYYRNWRAQQVAQQKAQQKGCAQPHTDTDTDTNTDKKKRVVNKFTPPSLEEVESYCQDIDYSELDAGSFIDFYESKGWMVGKNKMKCWKSAVRTWKRRQKPDLVNQATRAADEDEIDNLLGFGK